MRTLISVLLLIIFSIGVASISVSYFVPMNLFYKISVFISGVFNVVLAIELITKVSFAVVNQEENEEE
tara:strand:+ start:1063 stop:1266 length:204 start_codon:yes stop_codon:yes gene_type:complete